MLICIDRQQAEELKIFCGDFGTFLTASGVSKWMIMNEILHYTSNKSSGNSKSEK